MPDAVAFITLAPPSWISSEPLHPPFDEVRGLEELGLGVRKLQARNKDELERALDELDISPEVRVVVVLAHGFTLRKEDGPSCSCLLHSATNEACRVETGVDVERLVSRLRVTSGPSRLVVLDACEIELRDTLDGGPPLGVLLAQPSGPAEAFHGNGLLSQCFARQLRNSVVADHKVAELLQFTVEKVRVDSQDRQRPLKLTRGSSSFLDQPLSAWLGINPPTQAAAGSREALRVLVDVCDSAIASRTELPPSLDASFYHRLRSTHPLDDNALELALIVGAWLCLPGPGKVGEDLVEGLEKLLMEAERRGIGSKAVVNAIHAVAHHLDQRGDEAPFHLARALRLAEKLSDEALQGRLQDHRATIYRNRGELTKAENLYRSALERKAGVDALGLEISRQNLGWCLMMGGDFVEAQAVFRGGLRATSNDSLAQPASQRPEHLFSALHSSLIHAIGWCTASLALTENAPVFSDLLSEIGRVRSLAGQLSAWAPGLSELLRILELQLDLGRRRIRKARKPREDVSGLELIWSSALSCGTEGGKGVDRLASSLDARTCPDFEAVSLLAALHFLYDALGLDSVKPPRDALIRVLRSHRHWQGLPRPDDRPWSNREQHRALRVDTSRWPTWGPLDSLVRSSSRTNLHVDPSVTEKYLQCLAWCSALLIAHDSGMEVQDLIGLLQLSDSKKASFHTSFGGVLDFAQRVAAAAQPQAVWARGLAAELSGPALWRHAGYDGCQSMAHERNAYAHYRNITAATAQRIIDDHQTIIERIATHLDSISEVCIEPAARGGRDDLVPALLVCAGRKLDCGPLLMVGAERPDLAYVLQGIDLTGSPDVGMKVRVALYGDPLGEDKKSQRTLTWRLGNPPG